MKLIPFTTYAAARAADLAAMAYLRQDDNAKGSQWSGVYAERSAPNRFAIVFASDIVPAFTAAELGTQDAAGNYSKVLDGVRVSRDQQGNYVSGEWEEYTPQPEVS